MIFLLNYIRIYDFEVLVAMPLSEGPKTSTSESHGLS